MLVIRRPLRILIGSSLPDALLAAKSHTNDLPTALAIQSLRKQVQDINDAASEREQALVRDAGAAIDGTRIVFPSDTPDVAARELALMRARADYFEQNVELPGAPIKARVSSASMLQLVKADHNMTLDGIVQFEVAD